MEQKLDEIILHEIDYFAKNRALSKFEKTQDLMDDYIFDYINEHSPPELKETYLACYYGIVDMYYETTYRGDQ